MRRRAAAGLTIVETLVVCAVAIVILVLLTDLFITALQRTHDGRLRVDMQQRAIFALTRWERDLERASARSMVVRPSEPFAVALTPAEGIHGNGTVAWSETLICWAHLAAERQLLRDTYPPKTPAFAGQPSSGTPYLPSFVELKGLVEETSGAEKIMCQDVEEFSLTDRNGGTSLDQQPLLFRLKLRRPLSTAQNIGEFTVERRYTLRNSY